MTITEVVHEYTHNGTTLEGFFALPANASGKLPGVLVIHEWKGHNEYVRSRARQLAQLGYVAFALDQYGKGVLAKDHAEAAQLMGDFLKDHSFAIARSLAGLAQLQNHPNVDSSKIVAMGYCFGGSCCLELARHEAPLAGVATFHAGLKSNTPGGNQKIKTKVLSFTGYDDPWIPREDVHNFTKELTEAKVDFTFVDFSRTVHGFTVPGAHAPPAIEYNPVADHRSWAFLKYWLHETLVQGSSGEQSQSCGKASTEKHTGCC